MHVSGVAVLLQDDTESQSSIFTKSPLRPLPPQKFPPLSPKNSPLKIARGSAPEILDIHSFQCLCPQLWDLLPFSLNFFFLNQLKFLY